jgi:hypothetical protein
VIITPPKPTSLFVTFDGEVLFPSPSAFQTESTVGSSLPYRAVYFILQIHYK